MEVIFHRGNILILMGDFNVWVDMKEDRDKNKLLALMIQSTSPGTYSQKWAYS